MKYTRILLLIGLVLALIAPLSLFGGGKSKPMNRAIGSESQAPSPPRPRAVEQGLRLSEDHRSFCLLRSAERQRRHLRPAQSRRSSRVTKWMWPSESPPSAQALAQVFGPTSSTAVVFSAVTDADEAGLVAANIAGVSDMNPVEDQIKLLIDITGAKRIGNIYASGEANGVVLMEMAKAACAKLGVEFVASAISNSAR